MLPVAAAAGAVVVIIPVSVAVTMASAMTSARRFTLRLPKPFKVLPFSKTMTLEGFVNSIVTGCNERRVLRSIQDMSNWGKRTKLLLKLKNTKQ